MTSSERAVSAPQLEPHLEAAVLPDHDLDDEALLRSVHFDGHDLAGRTARLVDLEGCRLDRVTLAGTRLGKVTISDCVLDGCDLANTHLTEASMFRTVLHQTRLTGWDVSGGVLRHVRFEGCSGTLASLRFSRLEHVEFVGCALAQADFHGADLRGARFEDCDLTGAQFSHARMDGTRLSSCRLDEIRGASGLAGCTIAARDVLALTYTLAEALDITVTADE